MLGPHLVLIQVCPPQSWLLGVARLKGRAGVLSPPALPFLPQSLIASTSRSARAKRICRIRLKSVTVVGDMGETLAIGPKRGSSMSDSGLDLPANWPPVGVPLGCLGWVLVLMSYKRAANQKTFNGCARRSPTIPGSHWDG